MTQQTNGNAYFFYMCDKGEQSMPSEITVTSHQPAKGAIVKLLGYNKPLKWKKVDDGFKVVLPKSLRNNPPCQHVWTIKVSALK
jgi:alpha-L-fucosidase